MLIAGTSSKDEGAKCDPPLPPPPPKQGSLCACWREGWGMCIPLPCLPRTAKMRVLVKCRYKESLTRLRRIRRVLVVCTSDMKIHQQMEASRTANGMLAMSCCLPGSDLGCKGNITINILLTILCINYFLWYKKLPKNEDFKSLVFMSLLSYPLNLQTTKKRNCKPVAICKKNVK